MLHSGIDLHKRTVVISTVDADGRPVRDVQLPTKREALTRYFAALDGGPGAQAPSSSLPPPGTGCATCSSARVLTSGSATPSM